MTPNPREIRAGQLRKWNHVQLGGVFFVVDMEDCHGMYMVTYIESGELKRSMLSLFIQESSEPIDTGDANDIR